MLPTARRAETTRLVREKGCITVAELVERFGVSGETIRRDLDALALEGLVDRDHGGATLPLIQVEQVPPLRVRQSAHPSHKEAIGQAAAALVPDGASIVIDAGTTTFQVAKALLDRKDLTVITNDLYIAQTYLGMPNINVHLTGGQLKHATGSLQGPDAEATLRRYHSNIAFIGAGGISEGRGLTTGDVFEAEIKKTMIRSADRVVLVADPSKFDRVTLVHFADLAAIHTLVTTDDVPQVLVERLRQQAIEVMVVPSPASP